MQILKCLTIYNFFHWQNQQSFNKKNLRGQKKIIFHVCQYKIIKHLAEKSFSVFNGVGRWSNEHTNTFFGQLFYLFLLTCMKNVFSIISRFLCQILLVLSIWVISNNKAFQYLHYKRVFLDENPKTRFSGMKNPKRHRNIIILTKKNSWVI